MKRILVVDDMAVFREPIALSLRAKGFDAVCAGDGEEALRILRRQGADLVLLDMAMPKMDGLSVLRTIRRDPALMNLPVLLLTAVAERDQVIAAGRFGVSGYMLKSRFSLDELLSRVKRCLEEGAGADEGETETLEKASPGSDGAGPTADAPQDRPALGAEAGIDGSAAAGNAASAPVTLHGRSLAESAEALKSHKPIISRSDITKRIESGSEMQAMSPTVAAVLQITGQPDSTIDQIVRTIKMDQAIALKVLKLANTPLYARGERVDSVDKAVMRIGLTQIRQAVLNIGVVDSLGSVPIGPQVSGAHFWEHAIASGIIAAEIARSRGVREADGAFTLGLLHDVGRIIFAQHVADEFAQVVATAGELELPLEQVEQRMLLMNHAEGMDRILHAWKFPRELSDPIVHHHGSIADIRTAAPKRFDEIATVALANRLAHAMLLGTSGNETIYGTRELCQALKVGPEVIGRIEEVAQEQTSEMKLALLSSLSHGQEQWTSRRDHYQKMLAAPFRPLFVSESPQVDDVGILCRQLATAGNEPVNVAVVFIGDARERAGVSSRLAAAEAEHDASGLGIIAVSPSGSLRPDDALLAGRHVQTIPLPFVISRFVSAVNAAIEAGREPLAAAA